MSHITSLATAFLLFVCVQGAAIQSPLLSHDSPVGLDETLRELEKALPRASDGLPRIKPMQPVAQPCYSRSFKGPIEKNITRCNEINLNRTSDTFMTNEPGSYYFGNWGTCQRTGEACGISALETTDPFGMGGGYISNASVCHQGSVPDWYIDVTSAEDVQKVFHFATRLDGTRIKQPIVIKNTGHDWKGRSSGPGALALWTHRLSSPRVEMKLEKNFRPQGCNSNVQTDDAVIHFGAGEQWRALYEFAKDNGLAVLGGTCPTVGVAGWLHGGGHSPLSPSSGMGVDHIRQIRIVTPNGTDTIANECSHPDLFKAVKGGGGGTFGVVMELWYNTMKIEKTQEFTLSLWGLDVSQTREFIQILADNANDWASKGWGGYINTIRQNRTVTVINPKRTLDQAREDMQPLIKFAETLGISPVLATHDSWYHYFEGAFGSLTYHKSTWGTAVASRLIPSSLLASPSNRTSLVDLLLDLHYSRVGFIIMPVTPAAYPPSLQRDSVLHPTWRSATWLIRISDRWDSFYEAATPASNHRNFARVHAAVDRLRRLTPGMGVSISEADVWEPRHEMSFWGADNYDFLRGVKQDYDPQHVLRVIQGVGARDWDERFRCYPRQDDF